MSELSKKYGVSTRTLNNWFKDFWDKEVTPKKINYSGQVLILDGKYLADCAVVLMARTLKKVVSWHFTYRENSLTWEEFLLNLDHAPLAIVCDGQKGMIKAIRGRFPGIIIQRCQFHVIHYSLAKLTKKPESLASMQLRQLIVKISQVKTKEQFKYWLENYLVWRKTHHDFLKEKTYHDSFTPTGRRKWSYTHANLHAAHSHLKNALPHLFKYLLYQKIPNTTNHIEGGINSKMQELLRLHRGLSLGQRRYLIGLFLSKHQ